MYNYFLNLIQFWVGIENYAPFWIKC